MVKSDPTAPFLNLVLPNIYANRACHGVALRAIRIDVANSNCDGVGRAYPGGIVENTRSCRRGVHQ